MDLFTYLQDTFGVVATESELNEIKFLVLGKEQYIAESNSEIPIVSGSVCPDCLMGRDEFEPDWKCPACRQTDR